MSLVEQVTVGRHHCRTAMRRSRGGRVAAGSARYKAQGVRKEGTGIMAEDHSVVNWKRPALSSGPSELC